MKFLKTTSALTGLAFAALLPASAISQEMAQNDAGFGGLSLNQLMDMEVTSVSKKSEKASQAAAAIYVITQEDIRRSGATSIPEALRGVPGLQVAQSSSHEWAISSRGFNDHFANKLLVLIDGRSVYTPLFSGVYWDVQDTLLEDIDRIEIIRGPGATLWGANAVNGIINIITKSSKDTQGGLAKAGIGTEERAFGSTRYGGKISDNATYRGYVKYLNRDGTTTLTDNDARNSWENAQGGFRMDWDKTAQDKITLQGDIYNGSRNYTSVVPQLTAPFTNTSSQDMLASGANLLTRWTRALSETSDLTVQAYLDYALRNKDVLDENRTTFDIDMQHSFHAGDRHEIIWGTGYRFTKDDLEGTFLLNFTPTKRSDNLFSAFIQDKIAIYAKEVFLTLGSKFEHNDYTGFEYQPSARVTWLINDKQTFWTSVARAVRTPNRASDDISLALQTIPGFPTLVRQTGDRSAESEELLAYEAGYRIQPLENLSFDLATFYNDYAKLASNQIGSPIIAFSPIPHAVLPVYASNENSGETYGAELSTNWEVNDRWSLGASYSLLKTDLKITGASSVTAPGNSPEQQFAVRSHLRLPHNVEISNSAQYVDDLTGKGVSDYVRLDTRIGWKPMENVELNLVGQNLLDDHHQEFTPFLYNNPTQVDRSVYASVTIRF